MCGVCSNKLVEGGASGGVAAVGPLCGQPPAESQWARAARQQPGRENWIGEVGGLLCTQGGSSGGQVVQTGQMGLTEPSAVDLRIINEVLTAELGAHAEGGESESQELADL